MARTAAIALSNGFFFKVRKICEIPLAAEAQFLKRENNLVRVCTRFFRDAIWTRSVEGPGPLKDHGRRSAHLTSTRHTFVVNFVRCESQRWEIPQDPSEE
jgi:hypothetical protein